MDDDVNQMLRPFNPFAPVKFSTRVKCVALWKSATDACFGPFWNCKFVTFVRKKVTFRLLTQSESCARRERHLSADLQCARFRWNAIDRERWYLKLEAGQPQRWKMSGDISEVDSYCFGPNAVRSAAFAALPVRTDSAS